MIELQTGLFLGIILILWCIIVYYFISYIERFFIIKKSTKIKGNVETGLNQSGRKHLPKGEV